MQIHVLRCNAMKKSSNSSQKNKKSTLKQKARKVHLFVGLSTGLVVFILSITGCCWVFQEEIRNINADYKVVEVQQKPFLIASKVKEKAQAVFPDKAIHGVIYGAKDQAIEVVFYESAPKFYQRVYLNPYSGELLHIEDHLSGFLAFALDGHLNLWLPKAIGSRVASYSTLLFLLMVATGLLLWWPKNKKNRKQRLSFDWKSTTNWKRKVFDLHAVIGFYICIFAFIFAFTGSVMAFNWFYYIAFKATGGQKAPQFITPINKSGKAQEHLAEFKPIDQLVPSLQKAYPAVKSIELHYPSNDTSSILVELSYTTGVYYNMDYRFYDQNTLEELSTPSIYGIYADADFPDKLIRMNYDIHIGAIGGIAGKIIAFLASLVCASLPVTGFLIWWGKYQKKKNKVVSIKREVVEV